MSKREQRPGDWLFTCAMSGFTGWASDSVVLWNGHRVLRRFAGQETQRHPQEGAYTPPAGEGVVPWARPVPTATFRSATAVTAEDL